MAGIRILMLQLCCCCLLLWTGNEIFLVQAVVHEKNLPCGNRSHENNFCSPWSYCNPENWQCECGHIPNAVIKCDTKQTSVLDCHCVTYNKNEVVMEAGHCFYNCENVRRNLTDVVYHSLPNNLSGLNEVMCGKFNRQGTLCGECKPGFFPLAYTYNLTCVKCSHGKKNWLKFLLFAFLPLTVFYFIVLFCKISATSSHLHGFVLYSQGISIPVMSRMILLASQSRPVLLNVVKAVGVLYEIWNLDFFRSLDLGICLETGTLLTLSLDLAVGLYPFFLMIVSYVLIELHDRNFRLIVLIWKPFRSIFNAFLRNFDVRTSLIDAYATFFLLSNVKFLSTAFELLIPVKVYKLSPSGHLEYSWRLFYDASHHYFHRDHLPYAILALVVLVFFVAVPTLLVMLYPFKCFQKLLNKVPFRWYILHTFMDSFQGCYKDGTEPGNCDCRWFFSVFILSRVLLFIIYALTLNSLYFAIGSLILTILALLIVIVQPFKSKVKHYTDINAMFVFYIALMYFSILGIEVTDTKNSPLSWVCYVFGTIFGLLPLVYMAVITLMWMYRHRTFVFRKLRKPGYILIGTTP